MLDNGLPFVCAVDKFIQHGHRGKPGNKDKTIKQTGEPHGLLCGLSR